MSLPWHPHVLLQTPGAFGRAPPARRAPRRPGSGPAPAGVQPRQEAHRWAGPPTPLRGQVTELEGRVGTQPSFLCVQTVASK